MLLIAVGCSDMNDIHDIYHRNGEIIYIGRVDSAKILAGNERFLLRYWLTDPKAKTLKVYWSQKQDSLITTVPSHNPTDSIELIIGDGEKKITEGNHIFQVVTSDGEGLRSIVYEIIGNVYGKNFQSTITNRLTKQAEYKTDDAQVIIDWNDVTSSREIGVEISYYNLEGEQLTTLLSTNEIGDQIVLENVDLMDEDKKISYRTVFLPEPMALDTFYAESVHLPVKRRIKLDEPVNVALNKSVTASSFYNNSVPELAVDGIILSADSRFVTNPGGDHWLEIDLGLAIPIDSFKYWTGTNGQLMQPLPEFKFQVDVNGEWIDVVHETGNTNTAYEASFPEVTTSKVRLFVPSGVIDRIRMYEIAVYSSYAYVTI